MRICMVEMRRVAPHFLRFRVPNARSRMTGHGVAAPASRPTRQLYRRAPAQAIFYYRVEMTAQPLAPRLQA
jgi:hypothetical protein